ncbi:sulfurtransferase [Chitinimonas arctica]|uniref:Sulfurtransferase n=1 Tax=Chitinimonas arctica TaxID=2594795 RepID=A0A516SG20_9NEIS|nr:rhodanese-like domain-containing protein [Chitinimonas arctica]QDQ27109.1 sulfurtransferase [Chitinimonas arctica]
MKQLSPVELAQWLADPSTVKPLLLDVREDWEFALCHLDGATHLPMNTVPARHGELDAEQAIVVICHHGMRSYQVGAFLERAGFDDIYNLHGGVAAWAEQVDPEMARY